MAGFGAKKGKGKCNFIKFSKIEKYNNIFLWFVSKCSYLLSHVSSLLIYSLSNVVWSPLMTIFQKKNILSLFSILQFSQIHAYCEAENHLLMLLVSCGWMYTSMKSFYVCNIRIRTKNEEKGKWVYYYIVCFSFTMRFWFPWL